MGEPLGGRDPGADEELLPQVGRRLLPQRARQVPRRDGVVAARGHAVDRHEPRLFLSRKVEELLRDREGAVDQALGNSMPGDDQEADSLAGPADPLGHIPPVAGGAGPPGPEIDYRNCIEGHGSEGFLSRMRRADSVNRAAPPSQARQAAATPTLPTPRARKGAYQLGTIARLSIGL